MMLRSKLRTAMTSLALMSASTIWAQTPEIFKGADLANGESLIAEHQCVQCHASKVGGDGSAIYKPQGRINTAGLLRGMVSQCNTMLNMQMFDEDITDVAVVLNRDHYRFTE